MSGMKRFVAYIYSYENGEKNENIGFAKMEEWRSIYGEPPRCKKG